jgi:hypothetical protein
VEGAPRATAIDADAETMRRRVRLFSRDERRARSMKGRSTSSRGPHGIYFVPIWPCARNRFSIAL